MEINRGFYWVCYCGAWQPGYWDGNSWWIIGKNYEMFDDDFYEIGKNISK